MKKFVILLLLLCCSVTMLHAQKKVAIEQLGNFVGDTVTVCSRVMETKYTEGAQDDHTYIFVGGHQADAPLTLLIASETRRRFNYKPEKDLVDRDICVTGIVENNNGKLQITVTKQDQVKILPKR